MGLEVFPLTNKCGLRAYCLLPYTYHASFWRISCILCMVSAGPYSCNWI